MRIRALIAVVGLSNLLSAQVAVFERDSGIPEGSVVVLGAPAAPASLQGIRLLQLELVGRTRLTEGLPGAARIAWDVPGAARLVLPFERGSLYKYRRALPAGGAVFGYFLTTPAGDARPVFELPGTGLSGANDPLPGRIAVEGSGRSILVASSFDAGGDLWEIDLFLPAAVNRTPQLPPKNFGRSGLALLGTWGVGVSDEGVYRFDRLANAVAQPVALPSPLGWFAQDVVSSEDGSTIAFIAGDSINMARVFTCRRAGSVRAGSDAPMRIPGAGFLPEDPSGPALALSSDGSWIAWRKEASSRECYARQTGAGPRPPAIHLTGSTHFDNTLNDTGVIAFFAPNSMIMAAGRHATDGIEKADVYRIDLGVNGIVASNLTLTSAISSPPFDYGTLRAWEGLFQVTASPQPNFLCYDRSSGGRLLAFDAQGTTQVVLGQVDSLDSLHRVGPYLVVEVARPPGVDHPTLGSINLVQIPLDGTAPTILAIPEGCRITRESSAPIPIFSGVLELQGGGELLGRVAVPAPVGTSSTGLPRLFGPTTWTAPDGAVYATMQSGLRRQVIRFSGSGSSTLRNSPGGTFVLPGS
jgi:hypothetical protein